MTKKNTEIDFWATVDKTGECWLRPNKGTKFGWNGKTTPEYRVAYEITYGVLPLFTHIRHSCNNIRCVNQKHLHIESLEDRFWSKVEKTNTCWLWRGTTIPNGYGSINVNGSSKLTHRIAYQLTYGDINDLFVCHKCDNKLRVRPDHLFLGTPKDNSQDMMSKGRHYGNHRLNEEQVKEIRIVYATGNSRLIDLADIYNVDYTTIADAIRRKTWKNVL